uniref:Uncharacterized protein n=1 Tax=Anopheles merus TaxID=30066 RepID=A0A182V649_ANOME
MTDAVHIGWEKPSRERDAQGAEKHIKNENYSHCNRVRAGVFLLGSGNCNSASAEATGTKTLRHSGYGDVRPCITTLPLLLFPMVVVVVVVVQHHHNCLNQPKKAKIARTEAETILGGPRPDRF